MKLKELIKKLNPRISVVAIGEYIGMSRSRLNLYVNEGIEVQNMKAVHYLKLCDLLKVDYHYFMEGEK